MKKVILAMVVVLSFSSVGSYTMAANTNWYSATAEWDEFLGSPPYSNWSAGIPVDSSTAIIYLGTAWIHNPMGNLSAYDLILGYTADATGGSVDHTASVTLTVENDLTIADKSDNTSSYVITDGSLDIGGDMFVGVGDGSDGTFTQSGDNDPAVTVDGDLGIGHYKGTGTYTLSAASGSLTVGGSIDVGGSNSASYGSFNVSAGDVSVANHLDVGNNGGGEVNQSGGEIVVDDVYVEGDSGTYALGGGTLYADTLSVGGYDTGSFTQSGGICSVTGILTVGYAFLSDGTFTLTDGACSVGGVSIAWQALANGKLKIEGGMLSVDNSLYVGSPTHTGSAILEITDDENGALDGITVGDTLWFDEYATLTITSGKYPTITMTGAESQLIIDANADSGRLSGLERLTLVFSEPDDSPLWKGMEVAGEDSGLPVSGDFSTDNFVLNELVIGDDSATSAVSLCLWDVADNQSDGSGNEALYVKTLTIKAGGTFIVNGCSIYYLNGGNPKRLYRGDADLDGDVDDDDVDILENNRTESGGTWATGDFDGDGDVDDDDRDILDDNYTGADIDPGTFDEWDDIGEPCSFYLLDGSSNGYWITMQYISAENHLIDGHCKTDAGTLVPHYHFESVFDANEITDADRYWDWYYDEGTETTRVSSATNAKASLAYAMDGYAGSANYDYWLIPGVTANEVFTDDCTKRNGTRPSTSANDRLAYENVSGIYEHATVVKSVSWGAPEEIEWKCGYSGVYGFAHAGGSNDCWSTPGRSNLSLPTGSSPSGTWDEDYWDGVDAHVYYDN